MTDAPSPKRGEDAKPSIERFNPMHHDVTGFTCGERSLDTYIHERAQSDRTRRAAVVYVLVPPRDLNTPDRIDLVIGYFTINTISIPRTRLPKRIQRKLGQYQETSAVLIGRLAIDHRHKNRGYGSAILIAALREILLLADRVAIAVVVVHALHEQAAQFYRHHGFEPFEDNPLHLFYMLGSFVEEYVPSSPADGFDLATERASSQPRRPIAD